MDESGLAMGLKTQRKIWILIISNLYQWAIIIFA